ncbi:MAG TPA: phosphoribosyltransferase family protein [Bacteroidia bacterium]
MLNDFLSLFYPEVCAACSNGLLKHEETICTQCYIHLPKTNYHTNPNNPVALVLQGRFRFREATAFYAFHKKSKVQQVLHELKYKNNPEVGRVTGRWFGETLAKTSFAQADYLLPVPLHPKKQKQRGYNQSMQIAIGMSASLNIPVEEKLLYRKTETKTQTKKDKGDRWQNVEDIFGLTNPETFEGKKIILVDDVITTGATIESCANSLLKINNVELFVAALAFAEQ